MIQTHALMVDLANAFLFRLPQHLGRRKGQAHTDCGAYALLAFDGNLAVHQRNQLPHDGHAQTGAAKPPCDTAIGLFETVKDTRHLGRGHAHAGIADLDFKRLARLALQCEGHRALIGEFDRVVQKVVQDLADPVRIAQNRQCTSAVGMHTEFQPLFLGTDRVQGLDGLCQIVDDEGDAFDLHLAGFDLGHIEDVVEDTQQHLARAADRADHAALAFFGQGAFQDFGHAQNAVQRRPDFMAHIGQEHGFRLARLFGLHTSMFQPRRRRQFLGDVIERGDNAHLAAFAKEGNSIDRDAPFRAVFPFDGKSAVAYRLFLGNCAREGQFRLGHGRAIQPGRAPHRRVIRQLGQLVARQAQDLFGFAIGIDDLAFTVHHDDGRNAGIHDLFKKGFACLQILLQLFAIRNVQMHTTDDFGRAVRTEARDLAT